MTREKTTEWKFPRLDGKDQFVMRLQITNKSVVMFSVRKVFRSPKTCILMTRITSMAEEIADFCVLQSELMTLLQFKAKYASWCRENDALHFHMEDVFQLSYSLFIKLRRENMFKNQHCSPILSLSSVNTEYGALQRKLTLRKAYKVMKIF